MAKLFLMVLLVPCFVFANGQRVRPQILQGEAAADQFLDVVSEGKYEGTRGNQKREKCSVSVQKSKETFEVKVDRLKFSIPLEGFTTLRPYNNGLSLIDSEEVKSEQGTFFATTEVRVVLLKTVAKVIVAKEKHALHEDQESKKEEQTCTIVLPK